MQAPTHLSKPLRAASDEHVGRAGERAPRARPARRVQQLVEHDKHTDSRGDGGAGVGLAPLQHGLDYHWESALERSKVYPCRPSPRESPYCYPSLQTAPVLALRGGRLSVTVPCDAEGLAVRPGRPRRRPCPDCSNARPFLCILSTCRWRHDPTGRRSAVWRNSGRHPSRAPAVHASDGARAEKGRMCYLAASSACNSSACSLRILRRSSPVSSRPLLRRSRKTPGSSVWRMQCCSTPTCSSAWRMTSAAAASAELRGEGRKPSSERRGPPPPGHASPPRQAGPRHACIRTSRHRAGLSAAASAK